MSRPALLPLLVVAACAEKPGDTAPTANDTGEAWAPPDYDAQVSITQGVYGGVGPQAPLGVTVRAWPALQDADLQRVDDRPDAYGLYLEPDDRATAETDTDADGFYELTLAPGQWTVMAQDLGDWYCDRPAPEGVCLVTIGSNQVVRNDVLVDYTADY
jgi:hypothetical protein